MTSGFCYMQPKEWKEVDQIFLKRQTNKEEMEYVKRKRKLVAQFSKSNILLIVQETENREKRGEEISQNQLTQNPRFRRFTKCLGKKG